MNSPDETRYKGASTMLGASVAAGIAAGYLRYGWMISVQLLSIISMVVWAVVANRYLDRIRPKRNRIITGSIALLLIVAMGYVYIHPLIPIWVKALFIGLAVIVVKRLPLIFKRRKETQNEKL